VLLVFAARVQPVCGLIRARNFRGRDWWEQSVRGLRKGGGGGGGGGRDEGIALRGSKVNPIDLPHARGINEFRAIRRA